MKKKKQRNESLTYQFFFFLNETKSQLTSTKSVRQLLQPHNRNVILDRSLRFLR